jgi:hypothetical protein
MNSIAMTPRILTRRKAIVAGLGSLFASTVQGQEPVTAAAASVLGSALLKGAISYVGGELMASALGGAKINDVKTWIAEAVAELEAFVSAEIRRQLTALVITKMQADLEGIVHNIHEYAGLTPDQQKTNRFLVEHCVLKTSSLIPLSQNYDQALFVSIVGMAYRLFALYGLYMLDQAAWHIISEESNVDNFISEAEGARDRIGDQLRPELRLKIEYVEFSTVIIKDGKVAWKSHPTIVNDETTKRETQKEWDDLTLQLRQYRESFISAVDRAIEMTTECYGDMCRKVGSSYIPHFSDPGVQGLK